MKRVLLGSLAVPLLVACVVENTPPPQPPPTPTAPTGTATATASPTATTTATATATSTATAAADAGAPSAPDAGPSDDGGAPAQYRACKMDSDCVAVPRVGCCDNGWKEAVATSEQTAYESSFHCRERVMCPQYRVLDTRVALCENATHLCTMEKPEDVHCGGFIANSHKCPAGYTCPRGKAPDVGSVCVKSP